MSNIEPGKYIATALSAEFGASKEKGTEYVRVVFQLEGAADTIAWDGYFTEKTTQRTIESLRYCGCTFPGDDVTNLAGLGSQQVQLVVEHEHYKEKTYPRVKWVNRLGAADVANALDGGAKKSLATRLKGAVVAARVAEGAVPKAAPKPAAKPTQQAAFEPDFDDAGDVPF
jgi:hypothetical protein